MFTLIIVWLSGETDRFTYETREQAETIGRRYAIAFGQQVTWYGIVEGKR